MYHIFLVVFGGKFDVKGEVRRNSSNELKDALFQYRSQLSVDRCLSLRTKRASVFI